MRAIRWAILALCLGSGSSALAQDYTTWVSRAGGSNFRVDTAQYRHGGGFNVVPYYWVDPDPNPQPLPIVAPAPFGVGTLYSYPLPLQYVDVHGAYFNVWFHEPSTIWFVNQTTGQSTPPIGVSTGYQALVESATTDRLVLVIVSQVTGKVGFAVIDN